MAREVDPRAAEMSYRQVPAYTLSVDKLSPVTDKGELVDDPEVDLVGIPEKNTGGEPIDDIVFDAVVTTVEGLPKARKRDPDAMAESVRRAVRSVIQEHWGKKPLCYVHVLTV